MDIINPATEEIIATFQEAGQKQVDEAVQRAKQGFVKWSAMSPSQQQKIMWDISEALLANREEFARIESTNTGKPFKDTFEREIPRAAEVLKYFAGWATKINGETLQNPGYDIYINREPIGVVGAIVPWNFPLIISIYKIGPALACGNSVIIKPSEYTPLSILKFHELAIKCGLPEGVLNVVVGGPETGKLIVSHPDIDKIAFTGSVAAGKHIMASCADHVKKLHLELGGKSPHVIFEDADIDSAVQSAFRGVFYNAGQVCIAGSRLFVQKKIHDDFMDKLVAKAKNTVIGDPFNSDTTIGPLISKRQFERVLNYIEIGKKEGASLVTGDPSVRKPGFYLAPAIFDNASNQMRIAQEEIFGPVLSVIPFNDFEEAVVGSNDTQYGLGAGIWTRDIKKGYRAARIIKAGIIWVNCFYVMDAASPFGGYKKSGFGRDLGMRALDNYSQIKTIFNSL